MNTLITSQEEAVQVLVRLGLTCNQAKVYLALVRSGMSTAKTISKASKVAREDIYRIIPALEDLGLVERIVDTTSMYSAIPIQDAFRNLIKNRKQTTSELQAKTREIIQDFNNCDLRTLSDEETNEFVLLPVERAIVKRKSMIDGAQKNIDSITSWEIFAQSNVSYMTSLRNAAKRTIEIRIIVGNVENEKSLLSLTQNWREKYSCFRIRWTPSRLNTRLMLVDNQKLLFAKFATTSSHKSPLLWSINQPLVSVVKDYFEIMWISSFETKAKNDDELLKFL